MCFIHDAQDYLSEHWEGRHGELIPTSQLSALAKKEKKNYQMINRLSRGGMTTDRAALLVPESRSIHRPSLQIPWPSALEILQA